MRLFCNKPQDLACMVVRMVALFSLRLYEAAKPTKKGCFLSRYSASENVTSAASAFIKQMRNGRPVR